MVLTSNLRTEPYWWTGAPRPKSDLQPLPKSVDVAIIGSGHTGLSAAHTLAQRGRQPVVFEKGDPGVGASSRNAGSVGRTLKHGLGELIEGLGIERGVRIWKEVCNGFDYTVHLIQNEQIDCHLTRGGRYMAAVVPEHYDGMAKEADLRHRYLGTDEVAVPRSEQHKELGSDIYFGGVLTRDSYTFHPGKYHLGLLGQVVKSGGQIIARTEVLGVQGTKGRFEILTDRGRIEANKVLVATNGYTGKALTYFHRRLVPIGGYMVATEPLDRERLDRIIPKGRVFHDYTHNIYYLRQAPDSDRLLFGGLTGTVGHDLGRKAQKLHRALVRILPEMAGTALEYSWTGNCAGTFDYYPHIGCHDGIHYAVGYCFAGICLGTYLGHKAALQILGDPAGETVFDGRTFPSKAYYRGYPWFLPFVFMGYRWQDRVRGY